MKTMITFLMLLVCSITFAQDKIYVHTATPENTTGNVTFLDHPDLNDNPNASIVYSHVWNPNSNPGVYNNNIDGLWYTGSSWAIYNEISTTPMVEGVQFFIYIASDPDSVITHISTVANQGNDGPYTTDIDHSSFNSSVPGPYAIISNFYNPNNVYNPNTYSFYYSDVSNKRGMYNRFFDPIPEGAAFKILINGTGVTQTTHTTSAGNNNLNYTIIDHPDLNGNPDATFVFSHYWNLNGNAGDIGNGKLGAWYNGSNWSIYYEDNASTMQAEIAFDIIIAPQEILGVEDMETATNFSMFPNPSKGLTTITSTEEINSISIFNILGQEIFQSNYNSNTISIDISNYATGNYFIKVQTGESINTLKLIKN